MNERTPRPLPRRSSRSAPRVLPVRPGPVTVEVISIGRELLVGRIANTGAQTVSRCLTARGAEVRRITIVDDSAPSIAGALRETLLRNPHIVVTTGGLGPAEDDCTIAGVSETLALPLALHHDARSLVEAAYEGLSARGVATGGGINAAREKLCRLPIGSVAVPNSVGVAPGVLCRLAGGATVLCLPGLPAEAAVVLEAALPQLRLSNSFAEIARREVESPTADESALRPLLDKLASEFPRVSIHSLATGSPRSGMRIRIRLEATGADFDEANDAIESVVRRLLALAAGSP